MQNSLTQQAKAQYVKLSKRSKTKLDPGLHLHGSFIRQWYWISYGERAYKLHDLSDGHLQSIANSLKERHPLENREPIMKELKRRALC